MKILLDTHLVLWALSGDEKLSEEARIYIEDPSNDIYVSAASVWEVAIKHAIKPDKILIHPETFLRLCKDSGFLDLPISAADASAVSKLEMIHNDPFDRMLIAQADTEGLLLLTHDKKLTLYKKTCIKYA